MRKSSYSNNNGVKVTAKQREQLLDVLKPNIKAIVKEGVDKYIGDGTRFLLELLLLATAMVPTAVRLVGAQQWDLGYGFDLASGSPGKSAV